MASEGLVNISLQIPLALARRLDVKCEMKRKTAPGTGSRSNVIRTALENDLADIPDPKGETVAPSSRKNAAAPARDDQVDHRPYRPPLAPRRPRKTQAEPVMPPVRQRSRPAPVAPAAE